MKILVYDNDEMVYKDLMSFLSDVKVAYGGSQIGHLLKLHPEIEKYILNKQRLMARDLEAEIRSLHSIETNIKF